MGLIDCWERKIQRLIIDILTRTLLTLLSQLTSQSEFLIACSILNQSFLLCSQINSKYSDELAAESLEWIKEVTGEPINTSGDMDNFFEVLKDGVILCKLVNSLQPGTIKKVNESKMAFKCMENISAFLEAAKAFGVPVQETFQSVDLWERQNLNSVVICLQSLGRKVSRKWFIKPVLKCYLT